MSTEGKSAPDAAGETATIESRLVVVEKRLTELESAGQRGSETPALLTESGGIELDTERFWIIHGIDARYPEGGVVFAGSVTTPTGERFLWQEGIDSSSAIDAEWAESAGTFSALGHPVRLQILQYVLLGVRTTRELNEIAEVNTTGQLHHHLKELLAARWLESPTRGRYQIPVDRVVALLVVLRAVRPR